MTSGPPCANCGTPLRWYPEQSQWGCDRCRVMYPAQAVVAAAALPGKRARKRVFAIAAIGVVVLAGAAIAATIAFHGARVPATATGSGSAAGSGSAGATGSAKHASPPATPAPPPFDPDSPTVTLGKPVAAPIGDFWSWPRSDGAVLVTSPLFDAVFPSQPTFEIKPGTPTKDGHATQIYNIAVQDKAHILSLQVAALGRNARDEGAVAAMQAEMKKLGPVTSETYIDTSAKSQEVRRLTTVEPATATTEDSRMVVDARVDTARGLFIYATADTVPSYNAIGDAFLAHVHVRSPADAANDPTTLTGVRIRKPGKTYEAHDKNDTFVVELPWMAKVDRSVDITNNVVHVAITSKNGKASVVVGIDEKSAWDALGITPAIVDGLVKDDKAWAAKQKHVITQLTWNPFQHRLYRVSCTNTPCEAVIKSLRFADPVPTK
ncbi:MAG TPA: hypothetical protein VGG74_30790 [Kofleriaceae bacterium]